MWNITIDQIAESGKTQRYENTSTYHGLSHAVEETIDLFKLTYSEVGQFQITATSMEHDRYE